MKRIYFGIYGLGLLCLLAAFVLWKTNPGLVHGESFIVNGTNIALGDLPWQFPVQDKQKFVASVLVKASSREPIQLSVFPDDCLDEILVDGESVYYADFPNPCDYPDGIPLTIASTGKDHAMVISGTNHNDHGSLSIQVTNHVSKQRFAMPLFMLGIFFVLEAFLLQRRWPWYLHAITLCALALRFLFWSYTPWTIHSHDVLGHIDYILLILHNWIPPRPTDCWQCYQPPLYYFPAAWLSSLLNGIKASLPLYWGVQLLSFLANLGFLLAGLALIRRLKMRSFVVVSLAATFAFWPGLIVNSVRIGNDAFMYLFSALALRSLWIWNEEGKRRSDALWASLFAGLALASKTSGIATLATISLAILFCIRSRRDLMTTIYAAAIWIAAFALTLASPIWRYLHGFSQFVIVGNAGGLGDNVKVASDPGNFLWFDLHSWIMFPFTSAEDDSAGRIWFLNYAGKTSLFGEFHLATNVWGEWFAAILSLCALALIALAWRGFLRMTQKDLLWFLALALYVLALAAMRLLYPYSCSNDARYVLPAVIPFLYFVGRGLEEPFVHKALQRCVWIAIWCFPLASIALYLSMIPIHR